MPDKVQKIREVIEKRYEYWKEKEFNSHSIESEIRMSECQHLLLMLDSLQEEHVSEDLEKEIDRYWKNAPTGTLYFPMWEYFQIIAHHFAEWGKKQAEIEIQAQSMALSHGCPEENTSNELKVAADNTLESISDKYDIISVGSCLEMFRLGAKWQEKQDQETIELAEEHAMLAGMEKMKEQMMKNAIETTVKGYINGKGIYVESDIPLGVNVDEGDKVKLIIIKEG